MCSVYEEISSAYFGYLQCTGIIHVAFTWLDCEWKIFVFLYLKDIKKNPENISEYWKNSHIWKDIKEYLSYPQCSVDAHAVFAVSIIFLWHLCNHTKKWSVPKTKKWMPVTMKLDPFVTTTTLAKSKNNAATFGLFTWTVKTTENTVIFSVVVILYSRLFSKNSQMTISSH